ncbi:uncharacterized protein LOC135264139 [Anguilla rostrata]|uniref:uncharacterized protein LOC135264139 n=1 Tax=Anguilla rostrata TaxID=7938 RepID=UPI0030CB9C7E
MFDRSDCAGLPLSCKFTLLNGVVCFPDQTVLYCAISSPHCAVLCCTVSEPHQTVLYCAISSPHCAVLCCTVSEPHQTVPSPPHTVLCHTDLSQRQRASLVAVAGAVIGAILGLFLITVFTIVTLLACRSQPPTYCDKVIDLPPTHKPPPPCAERRPAARLPVNHTPVTHQVPQVRRVDRRGEVSNRVPVRGAPHRDPRNPAHEPLSYHSWVCHHKGADRVFINHREHYV